MSQYESICERRNTFNTVSFRSSFLRQRYVVAAAASVACFVCTALSVSVRCVCLLNADTDTDRGVRCTRKMECPRRRVICVKASMS